MWQNYNSYLIAELKYWGLEYRHAMMRKWINIYIGKNLWSLNSTVHSKAHFSLVVPPGLMSLLSLCFEIRTRSLSIKFYIYKLPLVHLSILYTLLCSTPSELSLTHCMSLFAHTNNTSSTTLCVFVPLLTHAASSLRFRPRTKGRLPSISTAPQPRHRWCGLYIPYPCHVRPTHNMRQPRAEAGWANPVAEGASDSSRSVWSSVRYISFCSLS